MRRNNLKKMERSELKILAAIEEIETTLGAHEELTSVVTLLSDAKNMLSDYLEKVGGLPKD